MNQMHRDIVELEPNSARARINAREQPEIVIDGEWRRWLLQEVRQGQTEHRKHEFTREKAWQNRNDDEKLGKMLTEAKMRCYGVLSVALISAAWLGRLLALGFG